MFKKTDELIKFIKDHRGGRYVYALLMEQGGKEVVVTRTSEPCYGGLRKYKSTHPNDCTDPETYKPGDLNNPFPDGTPLAVAFPFSLQKEATDLIEFLWSNESPYRKAFQDQKNLIVVKSDDLIEGFVVLETDVEPTVLVNLAKITKVYAPNYAPKFNTLVKEGATKQEAWIACACSGGALRGPDPDTYMFPSVVSIRRFLDADPVNFSGGTLKKRFDYSRKYIQDLFSNKTPTGETDPNEKGVSFSKEIKEFFAKKKAAPMPKDWVEGTREIIKKYS